MLERNHDVFASMVEKSARDSERMHSLVAQEQHRSHHEVLDALSEQTIEQNRQLSAITDGCSAANLREHASTRDLITDKLNKSQEVMRQEIEGLEQGLSRLQQEIYEKLDELKRLVVKINTTAEGPRREAMKESSTSVTMALMSLHELYDSLQVKMNCISRS